MKKYGGQICACLDFDADADRLILTHTYVEYKTVDDAKRDFKAHSIPYTDKGIKQAVREFLNTTELKSHGKQTVFHLLTNINKF